MIKEFVFGLLLGVLIAIPFWGIQAAGDIIGRLARRQHGQCRPIR